jgi:hypothetical protein
MTALILLAGAVIVAACGWLLVRAVKSADERNKVDTAKRVTADIERRRMMSRMVGAATERRAYIESLPGSWPFATACRMNGVEIDLLMDPDAQKLLFLLLRGATSFSPKNVYELAAADITDVYLEKRVITETRKRTEEVITPRPNNKSTVGRAVVGGVLLGPVGAMVGAASSMKAPPPKIEQRTIEETIERDGVPLIVIATTDPARPLLKLDLTQKAPTEEWHARLIGASSKARR